MRLIVIGIERYKLHRFPYRNRFRPKNYSNNSDVKGGREENFVENEIVIRELHVCVLYLKSELEKGDLCQKRGDNHRPISFFY